MKLIIVIIIIILGANFAWKILNPPPDKTDVYFQGKHTIYINGKATKTSNYDDLNWADCLSETNRFCSISDSDKRYECLRKNEPSLSKKCLTFLDKYPKANN